MIQDERPPRASAPPHQSCTQMGWAAPLSRCALPHPLHSDHPPRYGTQTLYMPYTLSSPCSYHNSPRWPFINPSSSICLLVCVCVCVCVCVSLCVRGPIQPAHCRRPVGALSSSLSTDFNHETEVAVAVMMLLHLQELLILQELLQSQYQSTISPLLGVGSHQGSQQTMTRQSTYTKH